MGRSADIMPTLVPMASTFRSGRSRKSERHVSRPSGWPARRDAIEPGRQLHFLGPCRRRDRPARRRATPAIRGEDAREGSPDARGAAAVLRARVGPRRRLGTSTRRRRSSLVRDGDQAGARRAGRAVCGNTRRGCAEYGRRRLGFGLTSSISVLNILVGHTLPSAALPAYGAAESSKELVWVNL